MTEVTGSKQKMRFHNHKKVCLESNNKNFYKPSGGGTQRHMTDGQVRFLAWHTLLDRSVQVYDVTNRHATSFLIKSIG